MIEVTWKAYILFKLTSLRQLKMQSFIQLQQERLLQTKTFYQYA